MHISNSLLTRVEGWASLFGRASLPPAREEALIAFLLEFCQCSSEEKELVQAIKLNFLGM